MKSLLKVVTNIARPYLTTLLPLGGSEKPSEPAQPLSAIIEPSNFHLRFLTELREFYDRLHLSMEDSTLYKAYQSSLVDEIPTAGELHLELNNEIPDRSRIVVDAQAGLYISRCDLRDLYRLINNVDQPRNYRGLVVELSVRVDKLKPILESMSQYRWDLIRIWSAKRE